MYLIVAVPCKLTEISPYKFTHIDAQIIEDLEFGTEIGNDVFKINKRMISWYPGAAITRCRFLSDISV